MKLYTEQEMLEKAKEIAAQYCKQFYCDGFDEGQRLARKPSYQQSTEFGGDEKPSHTTIVINIYNKE